MCNNIQNQRACQEHWTEYIRFLRENPCMVKNSKQNEQLWGILCNRLNKINDCKKAVEKWKEAITNWRNNALSKHKHRKNLNDNEDALIKLLNAVDDEKKCVTNRTDKNHSRPSTSHTQVNNNQLHRGSEIPKPAQLTRSCPIPTTTVYVEKSVSSQRIKTEIQPNSYEEKLVSSPRIKTEIQPNRYQRPIGVFRTNNQRLLQPLQIYYQNVRGLRTKLEKFSNAVLREKYDIIILTETWLLPAIKSYSLFDDRYLVFRTDRSVSTSEYSRGGGVLIAILKMHGVVKRHITNNSLEDVWVSLPKYDLIVGAVYFPPRSPATKYKQFLDSVNMLKNKKQGIIMGDFNMRRISWTKDYLKNECISNDDIVESFKTLLDGLKLLGVKQRNYVVNSTGVILDLVFTDTHLVTIEVTNSPFVPPDYHHPPLKIGLSLQEGKPSGG